MFAQLNATVGIWLTLIVLHPLGVYAQAQPIQSFADLKTVLERGDKITITDEAGKETTGKISALADTEVTLGQGTQRFTFTENQVTQIVQEGDSVWNGAAIGAAVPWLGLLLISFADFSAGSARDDWRFYEHEDAAAIRNGVIVISALSAGVGALVDTLFGDQEQLIYTRMRRASRVTVGITPHGTVGATIRF